MNWKKSGSNSVEGFCLIKSVDKKVTAKGLPYLDMTLSDSSGEINAKLWDYKEDLQGWIKVNCLIKVRGTISLYNETMQLKVERIRPTNPDDGVKMEDYVPCAPYSSEDMLAVLETAAKGFENEELRKLVCTMLEEKREKLLYWPAAFKLHHALRGGLLYHTLSIFRMAEKICDIYPFLNRDLLYTGVILHDIAKLEEFETAETGIAAGYTTDGTLIGHLVRGAIQVEGVCERLEISQKTRMLVEHMLISHHGAPEFGAAQRPMFPEAEVLSELDLLDSRIYEMKQALEGVKEDNFSQRQWALENRKLYQHGLQGAQTDAKLMEEGASNHA